MQNKCIENICASADDYPEDLISHLMDKGKRFQIFMDKNVSYPLPEILSRYPKTAGELRNVCLAITTRIYPKIAINTRKKRKFIVNNKRYQQAVAVEVCR